MRLGGFLQARISARKSYLWARVKTSTPKSFSTRFAEVETPRSRMLRFATAKLRDAEQAEEIVLVGT